MMPKTKTKKIDPYLKGYDIGYRKGRNERHEEDFKRGADLCLYSLMQYIADETQMSYEEVLKLFNGTAFYMEKINQGFLTLEDVKRNMDKMYGINMRWE